MAYSSSYIGSTVWLIVFSIIFLIIVPGNVLTILSIIFNKKLASFNENKFVCSLAITDLLVGLYIPYHVCYYMFYDTLGQKEWGCIVLFMVPVFACSHSICKLLTIAADRYLAILHPLHYRKYMTEKVVWSVILGGWFVTIVWSIVPIYYNDWDPKIGCDHFHFLPTLYFTYMLTPLFWIVWLVMLLVYIKIWKEASRQARRMQMTTKMPTKQHVNDSKSLQVVMLTLGCFSICWMPYFIVTTYFRLTDSNGKFSLLYEIAFTMAVCNSGMNPMIYAWKNSNFREAFWCLLTCRSPNNASSKNVNYITNHVPSSKKSSMANGSDRGGRDNAQTEIEIDEHECSVSTETNNSSWTSIAAF